MIKITDINLTASEKERLLYQLLALANNCMRNPSPLAPLPQNEYESEKDRAWEFYIGTARLLEQYKLIKGK